MNDSISNVNTLAAIVSVVQETANQILPKNEEGCCVISNNDIINIALTYINNKS